MTDYTHYERNMSRDEMALRLNIETALRKCCESECAKLKKELEDIKAAFETLLNGANANASALPLENEKLKKQIAELYSNGKEIDSLERENMKLKDKYGELLTCYNDLKHELDICTKEIKHLREITTDDHISNLATKLNYECATKENEKLRKKVANQKTQLVDIQQALLNRNMTIEALTDENDRLKKELIEAKQKLDSNLTLLKGANANASALPLENEKLKKQIESLTSENYRLKKEVKETRVVFEPSSYLMDIQEKDEEIKILRKKNLDLKNKNEGWKLKCDHLADVRDARIRERNSLEEQIKKLQEDYDSLKLTYSLMKLNPGYFTQPKPPINIENLNITYYENGPVWTSEEEETEDD